MLFPLLQTEERATVSCSVNQDIHIYIMCFLLLLLLNGEKGLDERKTVKLEKNQLESGSFFNRKKTSCRHLCHCYNFYFFGLLFYVC